MRLPPLRSCGLPDARVSQDPLRAGYAKGWVLRAYCNRITGLMPSANTAHTGRGTE
jgi:hypothetical protein